MLENPSQKRQTGREEETKIPMKILRNWCDSLIWCPSQCYLLVEHNNDIYTVYLRWRHEDPWTCEVVTGDLQSGDFNYGNQDLWSGDIFIEGNIQYYFRDNELDKAKKTSIKLAEDYLNKNPH